jgi:hypothetical protein
MDVDKVAVVANHGNGGGMEVFICTDSIAANESTTTTSKFLPECFLNFVATMNPRFEDGTSQIYPTIDNPKDSASHPSDVTLNALKAHVKRQW